MNCDCAGKIARVKTFLRYWGPLLVWMTCIFLASSDAMSAEHTSRFFIPLLHWLWPNLSGYGLIQAHFYLRKAAHVTEYAVLAALLFRALLHTVLRGRMALTAGVVLGCCAVYASSDEFHQSFVPSRTASAHDVAIDVCGALVAIALYLACARLKAPAGGPERI